MYTKIYELDKDNFIFCSKIDCDDSMSGPAHNILILERIQLKEISQKEKDAKLKEIEYCENYHEKYYDRPKKKRKKD